MSRKERFLSASVLVRQKYLLTRFHTPFLRCQRYIATYPLRLFGSSIRRTALPPIASTGECQSILDLTPQIGSHGKVEVACENSKVNFVVLTHGFSLLRNMNLSSLASLAILSRLLWRGCAGLNPQLSGDSSCKRPSLLLRGT